MCNFIASKSLMILMASFVSIFGWFLEKWKLPTNYYTNIKPKLLCHRNCFQKRCNLLKHRFSSSLIPTKLYLKFLRMKLLNCKIEARNSWNINEGSFLAQQKYLLSHLWDWWKDFQENLVVQVKTISKFYILIFRSLKRKKA